LEQEPSLLPPGTKEKSPNSCALPVVAISMKFITAAGVPIPPKIPLVDEDVPLCVDHAAV
jgi:hypothetical protein